MADTVLVYGASGAQGGSVVSELLRQGHTPVALVRTAEQQQALERRGAKTVIGDFADAASLEAASGQADKVFLVIPLGLDTHTGRLYGERAIDAAKRAGVKRLVFNTSTRIPAQTTSITAFEEKRHLEAYLAASGLPFVSLRPSFYWGNFLGPWTKPAILHDSLIAYPVPETLKAAWLSWEDSARFTVAALERDDLNGAHFDIGGSEALDGLEIAARFSSVLGREVRYFMVPHDAFEASLSQALGAVAAKSISDMYRWMLHEGNSDLFAADSAALEATFGVKGTPLTDWLRAQDWETKEVSVVTA